jgi:hypothetical protein
VEDLELGEFLELSEFVEDLELGEFLELSEFVEDLELGEFLELSEVFELSDDLVVDLDLGLKFLSSFLVELSIFFICLAVNL